MNLKLDAGQDKEFKKFMASKLSKETGIEYREKDIFVFDENQNVYEPLEYEDGDLHKYFFCDMLFRFYRGKELDSVEFVHGFADFRFSNVEKISNLRHIQGTALFNDTVIKDLGDLESIGGDAYFGRSLIKDLGNLKTIGGYADFSYTKNLLSLNNLESVEGELNLVGSQVSDLGKLERVGGTLNMGSSEVKDFKNLKVVGGSLGTRQSKVSSLGSIEYVGGNLYLDSNVTDLGNLKYVKGQIYMSFPQKILFADKIKIVDKKVYFINDPNYVLEEENELK